MSYEQQLKQWGQIVAKAWQDDAFKKRLLTNPALVLSEYGFGVPAGVQVRVLENTDRQMYLTIPAQPQDVELSDDQLEAVAGGEVLKIDGKKVPRFLQGIAYGVLAQRMLAEVEASKLAEHGASAGGGGIVHETPHQSAPPPA